MYEHLPEIKQLLDIDNILIYLRAVNCLSENDIHKIEEAEKDNVDKAVHELARLVKKRGKTCLERFFKALRRSAHEENNPGHIELLAILEKAVETTQGAREVERVSSFVVPGAVVSEPAETVWVYGVERAAAYAMRTSTNGEDITETAQDQELQDGDGREELRQVNLNILHHLHTY